jgi:signal transduction histidine kinase/DNA-binding NarL/FixJ family response regulator
MPRDPPAALLAQVPAGLPAGTSMLRAAALRYPTAAAYVSGVGLALVATALQWLIAHWAGDRVPYLLYGPAVMVAAATVGRGPAVLVLLAGLGNTIAHEPGLFVAGPAVDFIAAQVCYVILGVLLVQFGGRLRLTTARAAVAERRLALAQEHAGVGVFELDFDANEAFVSATLRKMLQRPAGPASLALSEWLAGLPRDLVEGSQRTMNAQIERGVLDYEREQHVTDTQGGSCWLLTRVRLTANRDGKVAQARGVTIDITARKRVDELLRSTQTELQRHVADLERLHALSQDLVAAADDLGAPLKSLLDLVADFYGTGHGIVSLCEPGAKALLTVARVGFTDQAVQNLPRTLAGGETGRQRIATVAGDVDDADLEAILVAHRALASQEGLKSVHSMPLRSSRGEVLGAISVMFGADKAPNQRETRLSEVCAATAAAIVERERARARLDANEQRFAVVLQSSAVPFTILTPFRDAGGRIVDFVWRYANPAAAAALHRPLHELLDRRIGEVLPLAWQAEGLFDRYVQVIERNEPQEFEIFTNTTGHGGWFNVTATPLQGAAAVWFANITERKRQQAALQDADRRKDEFLATLAHELRNPLAPMRQAVRIACMDGASPEQRRWSHQIIERQVHHMSLLLDDLLDVARITRGKLLLRPGRTTLAALVEQATEIASPHIQAKHHRLSIDLPQETVALCVDALRIAQVLGNLLTNAAKYTDAGGAIRLAASVEAAGLVIRVSDTGIGLSAEQMGALFTMFSQLSGAAGRAQGGLGIGLALSRQLVELHGGSLDAVSRGLGTGSEFVVRLPTACLALDVEPDEPAKPVPARAARYRILVADDNADAADTLAELLRSEGHDVVVAYDGAEALDRFEQFQPEAALLDVGMPRLSGLEVARRIRQRADGTAALLIAVTGWGQDLDRNRALDAGFDHHAIKPIEPRRIQGLLAGIRRGAATEALYAPAQAHDKSHERADQKHDEQDLGDSGRAGRNAAEAK